MRQLIATLVIVLALPVVLAACGGDSTLTIHNSSSFVLDEINLSPVDSATWGPDLLGGESLFPGESLEIIDIDCGDYDVRIIDEDNDECIIEDLELCLDDEVWNLTNTELAVCTLFSREGQ